MESYHALGAFLEAGGNASMIGLLYFHIRHHTRLTVLETQMGILLKKLRGGE